MVKSLHVIVMEYTYIVLVIVSVNSGSAARVKITRTIAAFDQFRTLLNS